MFKWLKFLFQDEPEKVNDTILHSQKSSEQKYICELHKNYSGDLSPTNNCNICWEGYSKKLKH